MTDRKIWFITGAGRGMGVDFARAALAAGHAVVATGRNPDAVTRAVGASDDLLVVKLDVGPKGALVHFHNDTFPDLEGLISYVQRLKGTAKLRPDSKLVITRAWPDAASRVNGALQLSRGLAKILG